MAETLRHAINWGKRTLSWENRNTVVWPINSTIISLVNKVIHDNRLHRYFFEANYWFFDGNWISGLCIHNGFLSPQEFEIVWSDRNRLPFWLLDKEEEIKHDYLQYAYKGFYYHSHYTLPY